jgi:hypothetical protein
MAKRSDVNRRPAGRPRSARPAGQRSTLSLRITKELFEALNAEATATGRTLSAVAELRLEFAGRDQQRLGEVLDLAFGSQISSLAMLIANVMREAVRAAAPFEVAPDWTSDAFAYDQVAQAVAMIFEMLRPEGEPVPNIKMPVMGGADLDAFYRNIGRVVANTYITSIRDPDLALTPDLQRIGREVREKLGPAVVGRLRRPR